MFEQRICRAVIALSIVLAAMLVASCGGGIGGPPKEVSDVATRQLYDRYERLGTQISNVEVTEAFRKELTPALRANGYEDAWCFRFALAKWLGNAWFDEDISCVVLKRGAQWEATCGLGCKFYGE